MGVEDPEAIDVGEEMITIQLRAILECCSLHAALARCAHHNESGMGA